MDQRAAVLLARFVDGAPQDVTIRAEVSSAIDRSTVGVCRFERNQCVSASAATILIRMRYDWSLVFAASVSAVLQLTLPAQTARAADCLHTPAASSAERKAILNTLRKPVERELGQDVRFLVEKISACRNWAFVEATPQKPTGQPVDWSMSSYAGAVKHDACGFYVHALLTRKSGRWRVRHYEVCATDVPYVSWPIVYGAPPQLFPYTE